MRWLVPPLLTAGITISILAFGEDNDAYQLPMAEGVSVAKVDTSEPDPIECGGGATLLSDAPNATMAVCDDLLDETCEQDLGALCPVGWNLCTQTQFVERNGDWSYNVGGSAIVVGAIYDRDEGGFGHFTVGTARTSQTLGDDLGPNCGFGTTRGGPAEVGSIGCNERHAQALCCLPTSTCGNGVVDSVEEQCDDGNRDDSDECLSSCSWREPSAHGIDADGC